jgi:hypothetical protein
VTASLGGRGVFGVELFVKGDMVWFSEVSPRPHDTGMVTMATQVQSEFELHAKAILGLPVNPELRSPGASAVIYGQLDQAGIAFEGVAEALRCRARTSACSASRNPSRAPHGRGAGTPLHECPPASPPPLFRCGKHPTPCSPGHAVG